MARGSDGGDGRGGGGRSGPRGATGAGRAGGLAAGERVSAAARLRDIAATANDGGMLPEQV